MTDPPPGTGCVGVHGATERGGSTGATDPSAIKTLLEKAEA